MSEKQVRPATENEVALWRCETCGASGALLLGACPSPYDVIEGLVAAHIAQSSTCLEVAGPLRLVRPAGWYEPAIACPPPELKAEKVRRRPPLKRKR